jgi:GDP-L-fucose synthase
VNRSARIFVAGGATLIGVALLEALRVGGYREIVGAPPDEPDLTDGALVEAFFDDARPEYVFLVGGRSGGIQRNRQCPAELMRDNLLVAAHVIHEAHSHDVAKLLYLASSCGYPKNAPQPLRVESLMTGPLEPTNVAYATAKLAGWQLCDAYREQYDARFITAFPANSFGPHDDFSPEGGHVIPALLRRAHEAKVRGDPLLPVWGTGTPRREFVYSRDLADACLFVMQRYHGPEPINLGGGAERSIADVAREIAEVVGYRGRLCFDANKTDGAPLKCLDSRPLRQLGWSVKGEFREQLRETYRWYLEHVADKDDSDARAPV